MQIDIELRNIEGYILGVSDWSRGWDHFYRCTQTKLSKSWSIDAKELTVDSSPYSLEAVKWFFERFGWVDVNITALQDAQTAFLKRRRQ